jgi:hypothetical protein
MSQAGGIGGQVSFTGPDAAKILERLSQFPQSVHDHPVGYEVELANYNTIPIPVPTAEEREDRNIVLKDCFDQKMGFLKALSDMSFLLSENASLFFDNLPPQEDLLRIQGQYRTALNGLMAHAIRVSTGKMDPPQTFVANPAPPPLNFKKKPFSSAAPMILVPDFIGMNILDALRLIASIGLMPSHGTSDRSNDPQNLTRVVEQSIKANDQVQKGTLVTVRYGVIPQDMPDAITLQLLGEGF